MAGRLLNYQLVKMHIQEGLGGGAENIVLDDKSMNKSELVMKALKH